MSINNITLKVFTRGEESRWTGYFVGIYDQHAKEEFNQKYSNNTEREDLVINSSIYGVKFNPLL